MTIRRPFIATGEIYHIYNKSIAKTLIFNKSTLKKALEIINYYRYKQRIKLSKFKVLTDDIKNIYLKEIYSSSPLVDFLAFSFMPNHFHFLIKQLQITGIRQFVSNFQNSFAKFFNLVNKREGSLFLNSFKYRRITTREEFLHVCRYIHLNPITSRLIEFSSLINYPFSSYYWYLNEKQNQFINTNLMTHNFKSNEKFIKFHATQIDHQQKLYDIKKLLIDG